MEKIVYIGLLLLFKGIHFVFDQYDTNIAMQKLLLISWRYKNACYSNYKAKL